MILPSSSVAVSVYLNKRIRLLIPIISRILKNLMHLKLSTRLPYKLTIRLLNNIKPFNSLLYSTLG